MARARMTKPLVVALAVIVVASLAMSGGAAVAATESASPTAWTAPPSPHGGELTAISCISATRCFAAGRSRRSTRLWAIAEQWDGTHWSVMSVQPAGASSWFDGISCTSITHCVAVGAFALSSLQAPFALIEVWDGHAWSIAPNTKDLARGLESVSCTSAANCITVGLGAAARWDGHRWSSTELPVLPFGLASDLSGVSCATETMCVAVGVAWYGAVSETLVEAWNGTRWSIVDTPTKGSDHQRALVAVACVSVISCFATGRSGGDPVASSPLIEQWDGVRWSVMHSPSTRPPYRAINLSGVSCVSAISCVAVGSSRRTDILHEVVLHELVETWDGSEWSLSPTPQPPTNVYSALDAVSCTPEHCAATGYTDGYMDTNGFTENTLVLSGNVPRRIVRVTWSGAAQDRLLRVAAALHTTPAHAQKVAVYFVAYILGLGMQVPDPAALSRAHAAAAASATYTTVWAQSELSVLDLVRMNFGPSGAEATRFAVGFFASYLGIS